MNTIKRCLNWIKNHLPSERRLIQVYAALLYNANLKGYITGSIFTGDSKGMCVPGLNCYSCPGAVGACPLGSLQSALKDSNQKFPFYILGILVLFGLSLGRTICGFLCPMGMIQELLYKIKTPKIRKGKSTRILSYFKYVLLAVLVIIVPIAYGLFGLAVPAFCKYVCPAGMIGGAFGLLGNPNTNLFPRLGELFTWKFVLVVFFLVMCIFVYRLFCRFFCPLGAIYGFFNRYSFLGIQVVQDKCTDCGLCVKACKMDVRKVGDHECINCGECINVCPTQAITWKGSQIFLHGNQINVPAKTTNIEINGNALSMPLPTSNETENKESLNQTNEDSLQKQQIEKCEVKEITKEFDEVVKKRKKIFKITCWSTALVVLTGALVYYNFIDQGEEIIKVGNNIGDVCPDQDIKIYGSDEVFNVKNHQGQIVIINFWYTSCGPCVKEMPYFDAIQDKYSEEVYVIAINGVDSETQAGLYIDSIWKDFSINFGIDVENDYYGILGGDFAYPYTIVVDQEGIIQFKHPNDITQDILESNIDSLLSEEVLD